MSRATELRLDIDLPGADTTVCWWLLEGGWHPAWSQFILAVVHLREQPGAPAPVLRFPGATHELMVVALNPERGRRTPEGLEETGIDGHLTPIDVVHQFTATDDEMRELAALLAQACVDGHMNPSTDDARDQMREGWLQACVKTLAHMRGEEHAP